MVGVAADRFQTCPIVFVFAVKDIFHRFAYVLLSKFFLSHFPIVSAEGGVRQAVIRVDFDNFFEGVDGIFISILAGIDQSQIVDSKGLSED